VLHGGLRGERVKRANAPMQRDVRGNEQMQRDVRGNAPHDGVLPVNKKVDVSRARTMMHGGWHARSGASHNEQVTSTDELRI
jgi:hypothetical protein